jgi:hypothetical protein
MSVTERTRSPVPKISPPRKPNSAASIAQTTTPTAVYQPKRAAEYGMR